MNKNSRVPVVPLPIELGGSAINKELVIDYTLGKLYIKTETGLIDITEKLKEQIISGNITLNNSVVYVEGYGNVKLGDFVLNIMTKSLIATNPGEELPMIDGYEFDFLSITNKNKKLQIVGYDRALVGSVPYKSTNGLIWQIPESGGGGSGDGSSVIAYEIPVSEDGKVGLIAKPVQYTSNINSNIMITFPVIGTSYLKITWKMTTGENTTLLSFPSNITWELEDDWVVDPSSTYIFIFESFDYGTTWLAKRTKYGKTQGDAYITVRRAEETLYTKTEVDQKLSWINENTPQDHQT